MKNDGKIKILFEVVQNYYWPAMKPIYDVLSQDPRYDLSLRIGPNQYRFLYIFLLSQKKKIEQEFRSKGYSITDRVTGYDFIICGDTLKKPHQYGNAYLVNVDHGPCFKSLRYRNLLKQPDTKYVVLAEGPYRLKKLTQHKLNDKAYIYDVGLPKLDPFFNGTYKREDIIKRHNLDPEKKIALYAPTYKPTSIFHVAKTIGPLSEKYNIIVKLHPYSWTGKYVSHKQHRIFEDLVKQYPKLTLVDPKHHDIMPYLFASDTMISEASSVINEFLALSKVGIIYDLEDETLKHSDGDPLLEEKTTEWLKDSYIHINKPENLERAINEAVFPSEERIEKLKRDKEFIYSYTDDRCSYRVKDILDELYSQRSK